MFLRLFLLAFFVVSSQVTFAADKKAADADEGFLDRRYEKVARAKKSKPEAPVTEVFTPDPAANDSLPASNKESWGNIYLAMTEVQSQGGRGTCSIFSAIGLLEAMMKITNRIDSGIGMELNLSEEYLEYLATLNRTSDGSSSDYNFDIFRRFGAAPESAMKYIAEDWSDMTVLSGLAKERCGTVSGDALKSCLIGHRRSDLIRKTDAVLGDPNGSYYDTELLTTRKLAQEFRDNHTKTLSSNYIVSNEEQVKRLLLGDPARKRPAIPVTLDLDFYYGAWNHRLAEGMGGMTRDTVAWKQGIVGYPEPGSVDAAESPKKPAGHSIIVVGYDDEMEIRSKVLMKDGTWKESVKKGVYFFKNSWGVSNFGTETNVFGKTVPGYGIITQDYAHDHGMFFALPLKQVGIRNPNPVRN